MKNFIVLIKEGGISYEMCRFHRKELAEEYCKKILPYGSKYVIKDKRVEDKKQLNLF